MNTITGFEMAKTIQDEIKIHFSLLKIDQIQINDTQSDPEVKIQLTHLESKNTFECSLIAERQENNLNNIHFTLFNDDPYWIELYKRHRSEYVASNHRIANDIAANDLVPENLYLIQSADGRPGVDFITLNLFVDAVNLLFHVSKIFKTAIQS
ncbi:hypothetical protein MOO44_00195 (plasmid) [Nicoliella spurrieriana]|uniref:Uncharacterized protein n=1 Tax=Nicoliella spurrieriana TaxID=2925830 RepID=A0A976X4U6_9LACO|nr:hypothetical protein [Nicoliella spurrieriana]UQS86099.1 hypothetical protein MOO44_00195 [Nicoliella spurrieriana]